MKILSDERSVIGKQCYITLPDNWRKGSHNIVKGNVVRTFYMPGTALVLYPKKRTMSDTEEALIELLIKVPLLEKSPRILKEIRAFVDNLQKVSTDWANIEAQLNEA